MDKEDTINFIRSLLISKQDSYELADLLKDFKQETGHQLPLFGYKTPLDFLKSIPDTLKVMGSKQKIQIRAVESPKSAHITSLVKRQNIARNRYKINCSWENSISFPNYHNAVNLQKSYKRTDGKKVLSNIQGPKTHEENRCQKFVKNNASPISNSPVQIVPVKYVNDLNEAKNIEIKPEMNNIKDKEIDSAYVEWNKDVIHSEVLGELNEIPKLILSSHARIDEYIEVCVPEVYSPHKFSLQLRKYKIKLTNLMIQLQLFYKITEEKYMMLTSELKKNQLCAALYWTNSKCLEWYRAVILDIVDENLVIVLLIDYGTVTELEPRKLRYLHRQFGELPVQAFLGHLANIRPRNGKNWPVESSKRLLSLVFEKDLVAGVVDANYKESWLSVALTYTDATDIHISDTLVEEDFAVFDLVDSNEYSCSFSSEDRQSLCYPESIGRCRVLRSGKENYQIKKKAESLSYSTSIERLKEMFSV